MAPRCGWRIDWSGNDEAEAAVEATLGGLKVRASGGDPTVAVTGAPCPITVDSRGAAMNSLIRVPDGAELALGAPDRGLRGYLAVRGGLAVAPVLGSRSTDLLAGLGPDPLSAGQALPVGPAAEGFPPIETVPVASPAAGELRLDVVLGPRHDWFTDGALERLLSESYEVTAESNRIGIRLSGPALSRDGGGELASECMIPGAVQVPPSGQPTVFLADHPVIGGYPVIAVLRGPRGSGGPSMSWAAGAVPHSERRCAR
jgi:biotin-dependent carboxylase-like uncharacterized protein